MESLGDFPLIQNTSLNVSQTRLTIFFNHYVEKIHIIATETFAVLTSVVPSILKWIFRKYISSEIKTIPLEVSEGEIKVFGYLNIHGKFPKVQEKEEITPILLTHGDHSHPATLLHLADLAEEKKQVVFSLYLPDCSKDELSDLHDSLLRLAIDKIKEFVNHKEAVFKGILGIGHSKGGILLAKRQFVQDDKDVLAMCGIASRLTVPESVKGLPEVFEKIIQSISQKILENPEKKLFQIVPKNDWNASFDSMAVRPKEHCYKVPGMHLSGLYEEETKKHVAEFMDKDFLKNCELAQAI